MIIVSSITLNVLSCSILANRILIYAPYPNRRIANARVYDIVNTPPRFEDSCWSCPISFFSLDMPRISKHLECLSLVKLFVNTSVAISLVGVNSTLRSPLLKTSSRNGVARLYAWFCDEKPDFQLASVLHCCCREYGYG